ncbi:MAG TPA: hypothetical protein VJT49_12420 [Amycolatopsis sp.]|uniref:hypothetical protein n=1 Tax=Amycolatopsis sp. TaxID=37632 RepID=UPI002B49890D|nr:hypothetical protein [Amycolatopsis sp.]HKS45892.1 hypothetical protein [Amycolatopsis sp.]
MKITLAVGYEEPVLAIPRALSRVAVDTLKTVPRLFTVLGELRDAVKHIERLAGFAAEELPEVVFQLERVRDQLAAIELKLGADEPERQATRSASAEDGGANPDERRTG